MNQGIVVCTWSGGKDWVELCLSSLEPVYDKYPIYVVINDGNHADPAWIKTLNNRYHTLIMSGDYWEVGAILAITQTTDLDEFWFFQDTIEITDTSFIDQTFSNLAGITCTYETNPMHYYLGKWQTSIIRKMPRIEIPTDKSEAILMESEFYNLYWHIGERAPAFIVDPEFSHEDRNQNYLETKFNEERLSVVGKYLIKRLSININTMEILGQKGDKDIFTLWKNSWRKI